MAASRERARRSAWSGQLLAGSHGNVIATTVSATHNADSASERRRAGLESPPTGQQEAGRQGDQQPPGAVQVGQRSVAEHEARRQPP